MVAGAGAGVDVGTRVAVATGEDAGVAFAGWAVAVDTEAPHARNSVVDIAIRAVINAVRVTKTLHIRRCTALRARLE